MTSSVNNDSDNLYQAFRKAALQFPDQVVLVGEGGRGRTFIYAEALRIVTELASGLQQNPRAQKEEVGLLSENRPEWPLAYLACVAAGKTVVPIDVNLKPAEVAGIVSHSRLKLIFCSARCSDQFEKALAGTDILSLDDDVNGWCSISEKTESFDSAATRDSVAALIYTSGTTGAPKAVILTHGNLLANLSGIRSAFDFDQHDVFLSVLPLHHTFESTCGFLTPLTTGCRVVYARSLKSRDILQDLAACRATVMCGVPLLYEKMYQSIQRGIKAAPWYRRVLFHILYSLSSLGWSLGNKWGKVLFRHLRRKAGLGSVDKFVSGGAALPPHIARFFNLIGFDMLQGYGLTETAPVSTANRIDDIRFASVGTPLDGVKVKIDNPNSEGVGEILVQGANITPGYRDNPKETALLLRDGWLYTGDLGKIRKGHLWITGRAKNLIVSAAGKNIYPEELEEKLLASPLVAEAVVFGRNKAGRQGEEVRALIVPELQEFEVESGSVSDEQRAKVQKALNELVAEVSNQVADYKRISGFDFQIEELEKTSTKKVKRFVYSSKFKR